MGEVTVGTCRACGAEREFLAYWTEKTSKNFTFGTRRRKGDPGGLSASRNEAPWPEWRD